MIIRKKMPAYKGAEPRNFVLLWVEEDIGTKGAPATQPYYFEPTKEELLEGSEKV